MHLTESWIGRNLKKGAGGMGLLLSAGLMAGCGSSTDNELNSPTPIRLLPK